MESSAETLATLQAIVDLIVDTPEQAKVEGYVRDTSTHFVVTVPEGLLGQLIGKQGRTARAIRTLLACAGRKHGTHYGLDLSARKCKHCACTDNNACQTVSGNCHWITDFFPQYVCSNPACIEKETELRSVPWDPRKTDESIEAVFGKPEVRDFDSDPIDGRGL